MVKQVLKMLWSKKRTYLGVYIEQVFVFIVLSLCLVMITEQLSKLYAPGLLATENVVSIIIPYNPAYAESEQRASLLITTLKQSPDVIGISKSIYFLPYMKNKLEYDSVRVDHKMVGVKIKYTDENSYKIFEPKLVEGTWFTDRARADGSYSAVITKQFADQLGWNTSLGKQIDYMQFKFTIVGVMEGLKEEALTDSPASLILPIDVTMPNNITTLFYAIKLQSGTVDSFSSLYANVLSEIYPELDERGDELGCVSLEVSKNSSLYGLHVSITAMALICFFIILYTFIGCYGLISLHSERRVGEYALQIALGLTKRSLQYRVLLESLFVTLFATIPGIIIMLVMLYSYSIQMPIIISIVVSVLIMTFFSLFSAWLPAFKVTKLDPAEVLKSDL